jgi:hypothetical protein
VTFARDDLSRDKLDEFFRLLRTGAELELAARADEVGSSGLRMRRYMEREPAFKVEVEAALAEGYALYRDRLRSTVRTRATALEGGSDRLLEVELATHVPGYEHLRRDRVKVDGKIQHEHAIVLDPSVLELLPTDKLLALEAILAELDDVVDGDARELGPGE